MLPLIDAAGRFAMRQPIPLRPDYDAALLLRLAHARNLIRPGG